MEHSIFLSYSRKDLEAAKDLYNQLIDTGHSVWFDKVSLLPGQTWELEIRKAINEAKLVIICLSSSWINQRGYIQKELKLALEVMQELPEGEIHTIPVRLDDCPIPPSLKKLHWVDVFETNGTKKLVDSLESLLSAEAPRHEIGQNFQLDAYSEFIEDVISKGGFIHTDPWLEAKSEEETDFKALLKDRVVEGMDLLESKQYQSVIDLWAPLDAYTHFDVNHPEWRDKPYFRCQIQAAKAQLFVAHVQLGVQGNFEILMPAAFRFLQEVLTANPYSMKGSASERLSVKQAEIQNLNYRDILFFANEWFQTWGCALLESYGISPTECKLVEKQVNDRLHEIDLLFKIRT